MAVAYAVMKHTEHTLLVGSLGKHFYHITGILTLEVKGCM